MATEVSAADLRKLLNEAEQREAVAAEVTPHSALLADLADHRVHPGQLGETLVRIFDALDLLGVDLLADGGPVLRKTKAARKPAVTEVTTTDDTEGAGA